MKYIIYLRVSTKKQDARTQLDLCLLFLKNSCKEDFSYLVFTDSVSTKKKMEKRIGLQEALSSIRTGDILVAMRLDRLARNLYETTKIIAHLEKNKADVLMVEQPGIKNKVILGVYAGIAEEEVKTIRARIREKIQSKKMRGERTSRFLPYGFDLDYENLIRVKNQHDSGWSLKPGKLIENQNEQHVIGLMLYYFDVGMSYRQIAKTLDIQGYKNRNGLEFAHMSIYRILARAGRNRIADRAHDDKQFELLHSSK